MKPVVGYRDATKEKVWVVHAPEYVTPGIIYD